MSSNINDLTVYVIRDNIPCIGKPCQLLVTTDRARLALHHHDCLFVGLYATSFMSQHQPRIPATVARGRDKLVQNPAFLFFAPPTIFYRGRPLFFLFFLLFSFFSSFSP